MQPIVLCSYEVDAEPIFDATNSFQRAAHFVTDRRPSRVVVIDDEERLLKNPSS